MFLVNKMSQKPIYLQIVEQIEMMVLKGLLTENAKLPSVRVLSKEISINPNTIQKAYAYLETLKVCVPIPGSGRYISPDAVKILQKEKKQDLQKLDTIIHIAKLSGTTLDEIIKYVTKVYKEENND